MGITPIGVQPLPVAQGGLMPITTPAVGAQTPPVADKSFPLDALLQTGVQVAAAVGSVRQATGASANRQQRIAACGRRPFCIATANCKRKKAEYDDCVAQASAGGGGDRSYVPPPAPQQQSNTMTYVLIGLGILVVGGVAIFLLKRK